jgi:hypothetical protein
MRPVLTIPLKLESERPLSYSREIASPALSDGLEAKIRAKAPETCGVAIDVPESVA